MSRRGARRSRLAVRLAGFTLAALAATGASAQTAVTPLPAAVSPPAPASPSSAIATPSAPMDPAVALPGTKPLSASEAPRYLRDVARQLRAVIDGTPIELVTKPDGDLILRIPADYLFGLDAAQLRTEGPVRLDPLLAVLAKADRTLLLVVGHTDSLGTREFNAAWSLSRATAVADYLVAKGIAAPRVGTRGAGEMAPRERNEDSPAARQRNRRVEIEVRPFRPSRRAAS
jgi:outer membrane protein OmpA-like peptidoglycan-associated protein